MMYVIAMPFHKNRIELNVRLKNHHVSPYPLRTTKETRVDIKR